VGLFCLLIENETAAEGRLRAAEESRGDFDVRSAQSQTVLFGAGGTLAARRKKNLRAGLPD